MKECIVLVDANNLAFAAHHVHADLCTQVGEPTGLLYGAFQGIFKIARLFPKAPIVMIWDGPGGSWRKQLSPDRYKTNRVSVGDTREVCFKQIDQLIPIIDYLKIPQLKLVGVEADDLIGILAREFEKDFEHIIIRSADKDFYQLLDSQVHILSSQVRDEKFMDEVTVWDNLVDSQKVVDTYNVSPSRWVTFRALTGDKSDNLKGLVPGVGETYSSVIVASGLKLPAWKCPAIQKIARLRSKEITANDWARVNQNFRLCTILTDMFDERIPLPAQKAIQNLVQTLRETNFSRDSQSVDDWKLMKMLGRFELLDIAAQARDLIHLF